MHLTKYNEIRVGHINCYIELTLYQVGTGSGSLLAGSRTSSVTLTVFLM